MSLKTQENNLRQALSSDKRPLSFLIGAGCPLGVRDDNNEALIPDIAGLTQLVVSELKESADIEPVLSAVMTALLAEQSSSAAVTIETILGYIRVLSSVVRGGEIHGMKKAQIESLEVAICEKIDQAVSKELPNKTTPYQQLAKWVRGAPRTSEPVELFTTNYDLLMEQALEREQAAYFDGFIGSREAFLDVQAIEEDKLPARWARLWKLHGSANWYLTDSGKSVIRREAAPRKRIVIHPSHLKYDESRRMPFFVMFDRLKAFLRKPSATLVTCGYSFRDDHLNATILDGLKANSTAAVFALAYDPLDKCVEAVRMATERTNFSLLTRDGCVVGGRTYPWAADDGTGNSAMFHLGDFAALGHFLSELAGPSELS